MGFGDETPRIESVRLTTNETNARPTTNFMTDLELQQLRREKWRLDGKPIRTIEEARAFVESVGFCLMYPVRPSVPVPTFIGAFVGADSRLPTWQQAYSDPRAAEATEMMVRLLRERAAYEANLFDENNTFLVSASVFPYFYALTGERNPKQSPRGGARSPYSQLACDAYDVIRRDGPISKQKMQDLLGGSVSFAALDKALAELWSKLRITRVDYNPREGASWDVLYRWAPDVVQGRHWIVGGGGALGAAVEISGVRGRRRADRTGDFFRQLCAALESQGSGECAAVGAGVEFCARGRAVDAAGYAGEDGGGCGGAAGGEVRHELAGAGHRHRAVR